MRQHETYLGDGVTAYLEHGAVWLETTRAGVDHEICLEMEVYEALTNYVERLQSMAKQEAKRDE